MHIVELARIAFIVSVVVATAYIRYAAFIKHIKAVPRRHSGCNRC